jgi:uncharacterized protein (DUF58 family)
MYPSFISKRIKVVRDMNTHAFHNETIDVNITLTNTSRWPALWIRVTDTVPVRLIIGFPPDIAFSLPGRDAKQICYQIRGKVRGYYQVGPLTLRTGDLLGLKSLSLTDSGEFITVYPRIKPIAQLKLPSRLPFGTIASRQQLYADPARPTGVRDYRSGDSIRHINWKVSAHTTDLAVKTFQPAISLESMILLNFDRDDYVKRLHNREWAVEVAASLAAHLNQKRQSVGFMSNGFDPLSIETVHEFDEDSGRLMTPETTGGALPVAIPPHTGRANLMRILETLARIDSSTNVPFVQWATKAVTTLSWGTTVLVISPKGDEATCHTLHRMLRAGLNPILLLVEGQENLGMVRERARRLGFPAYTILNESDLLRIGVN